MTRPPTPMMLRRLRMRADGLSFPEIDRRERTRGGSSQSVSIAVLRASESVAVRGPLPDGGTWQDRGPDYTRARWYATFPRLTPRVARWALDALEGLETYSVQVTISRREAQADPEAAVGRISDALEREARRLREHPEDAVRHLRAIGGDTGD